MKYLAIGLLYIGAIMMWCGFAFGAGVGLYIRWMVQ